MLGNYILHFPLTDFAVSLLAVAAFVDVASRVLARQQWQVAVDWLLFAGFAGALAAVGSGLWLVAAQHHPHDDTLSLHHYFAYGTLGAAAVAVAARIFQGRIPKLAWLRTSALALSALLVSCAGYVGGKMAHPPSSGSHTHGGEMDHDSGNMPEMESHGATAPSAPPSGSATAPPEGSGAPDGSAATAPQPHGDGHKHAH